MSDSQVAAEARMVLDEWLRSCTRGGKISRNTVAVGIVVLDHLRKACPVEREAVVSPGGEIGGARSGLRETLAEYEIPTNYLKEVTTRQAHQDGQRLLDDLKWGRDVATLPDKEKDALLLSLIEGLTGIAGEWLKRQSLKLRLDRRQSPAAWIGTIVDGARNRSGGVVEQHLVGAKLARRFGESIVPNHPAHAADKQTTRQGDFSLTRIVYHVTASPSRAVLAKCAANVMSGLHPILVVPRREEHRARVLAQDEGVDKNVTIQAIEELIAQNIVELAAEEDKDLFAVLREIVGIYNNRLAEVETDLSLQIELG